MTNRAVPTARTEDAPTYAPQHGDLIRPGDEFSFEPWYYCAVCGNSHGRNISQCDGLRRPLGPTTSGFVKVVDKPKVDLVAKAIDDWIEAQRKAKAWDKLRAHLSTGYRIVDAGEMDKMFESVKE